MAIETSTFTSKHSRLRLVRQPGIQAYNAFGKPQGFLQKSLVYEFEEIGTGYGRLTLRKGQDEIQDGPLDPEKGEPTWQDAIGWIRRQPAYNMLGVTGGFVEDGREPGRIPDATDVLDDVSDAGVQLDPDRLREILEAEREGWGREQVVTLAERTLARVEAAIAAQTPPEPAGTAENGSKGRVKAGTK